jgi:polysaccharide biosynthesis protein PslH
MSPEHPWEVQVTDQPLVPDLHSGRPRVKRGWPAGTSWKMPMMKMCGHPDLAPPKTSRVLYIAYASPVPSKLGPARRHYHVLDQLARFYDVHFLCVGDGSEAEAFARHFGDRVHGFTFAPRSAGLRRRHARKLARTLLGRCDFLPPLEPALQQACASVTRRHRFDAIVLSSVLMRALPLPEHVPIVGDTHNVEFDVLRRTAAHADRVLLRQYARRQWPAMQREERRCGEAVDLVLATSVRDRRLFERELGLRRVAVVPNGVDLAEFAPSIQAPVPETILFSGLMSYFPNQQAVRWFLRDVFPRVLRRRPGVRLVVAGADPPGWLTALAGPNLEVTGRVPDIRPFVARAAVVVAPLMIGGGTRVKILEALAMARPMVSTSLGAEGLDLAHGTSALMADDPAGFSDAILAVLGDPRLADRLGSCGRRHVIERFDWNRIGDRTRTLLASTIGLRGRTQLVQRPALRAAVGES